MAKIEGTAEAVEFLRRYPLEANGMIKKALSAAGRPIANAIRRQTPYQAWRKMVRTRVRMSRKMKRLYMTSGYHEIKRGLKRKANGKLEISDWYKAYFMNYGTRERRDLDHKFDKAEAGTKKNRNMRGQFGLNFYDKAISDLEAQVKQKFTTTIERMHEELLRQKIK